MDYDPMHTNARMVFDECVARYCMNVTINDDTTLEKVESFYVTHSREVLVVFVDSDVSMIRIGNVTKAEIKIVDDERKNLYSIITSAMLNIGMSGNNSTDYNR